jgi:hypothetical protein
MVGSTASILGLGLIPDWKCAILDKYSTAVVAFSARKNVQAIQTMENVISARVNSAILGHTLERVF